jgi:hypothetical protein
MAKGGAKLSIYTWKKSDPIHRVHPSRYASATFNPSTMGNARFSPIKTPSGIQIPTIYGGSSFDCAAMETVFHDVPFAQGLKTVDKARLNAMMHSVLIPNQDIVLLDLCNVALRDLGIERKDLIDTEKSRYPFTRQWAEDAYAKHPNIQGLCWVSRQDDRARAFVLFGDRVAPGLLVPGAIRDLLLDMSAYAEVLMLADIIGVNLVEGRN